MKTVASLQVADSLLFISYSHQSAEAAEALADDISALGYQVWHDQDLAGGQQWWDRILAQIRRCNAVLLLVSQASLSSEACRREYRYALELRKVVVPVLIGANVSEETLPPELRSTQIVDYRLNDRNALKALVRALIALPLAEPLPDPLPTPPEAPVSDIATLRDRIAVPSLALDEQRKLVVELSGRLTQQDEAVSARQLLDDLRKRKDVSFQVANQIEALLGATERHTAERGAIRGSNLLWAIPYILAVWSIGIAVHERTGEKGAAVAISVVLLGIGLLYRRYGPSRPSNASS